MLDDVADKPVIFIVNAQRALSCHGGDDVVEFVAHAEAHVPIDVSAAAH